jgi:hypothetical protein
MISEIPKISRDFRFSFPEYGRLTFVGNLETLTGIYYYQCA